MKFLAILSLATAAAMAAPNDVTMNARHPECQPPQYACKHDNSGWLVCNVDGTWLDGGVCPKKTTCKPINNLPYCI